MASFSRLPGLIFYPQKNQPFDNLGFKSKYHKPFPFLTYFSSYLYFISFFTFGDGCKVNNYTYTTYNKTTKIYKQNVDVFQRNVHTHLEVIRFNHVYTYVIRGLYHLVRAVEKFREVWRCLIFI